MNRSPLAYPLKRSADMDVGGAADLQTDVMRFMAILALCLVAIFALVQSIPLAPVPVEQSAEPQPEPAEPKRVVLTRPRWVPKVLPPEQHAASARNVRTSPDTAPPAPIPRPAPTEPEKEGFTLRFASDAALMRAVAAHKVGVYAIEPGRARRMTVSESRISFWDASMPNLFHEMEPGTVPVAVTSALARSGGEADGVNWGVTLPGRMKSQLDALMEQHTGGALIIGAGGDIHWEAPP